MGCSENGLSVKVLVTGAAGFIGGNLLTSLKSNSIEVVGIDNFSPYYDVDMKRSHIRSLGLEPEVIDMDVCDSEALLGLFKEFQPTHVIHLAAQGGVRASKTDPIPYLVSNQMGFLNVLNASESFGCPKFLYASSSSVYGDLSNAPFQESQTLLAPKSLYALSKLSNELIAKHLPRKDTERIGFRFFTVYGPWGRPDMAVFRLLASSLLGEKFKLTANKDVIRDFTYVKDVSNVLIAALSMSNMISENSILNISAGNPFTLNELFQILEELEIHVEIEESSADPLDVKMTHGSVAQLQACALPVPLTALRDGITETWNWMNSISKNQLRAWFEYSS
jgi:UDP-glucuronate 4-epimerase